MDAGAERRGCMAACATVVAAMLLLVLLQAPDPAVAAAASAPAAAVRHYVHEGNTAVLPCWMNAAIALPSLDAMAWFRRVGGDSLQAWRERLRSRPPGSPPCSARICVERIRVADASAAIEADAALRHFDSADAKIFVLRIVNVTLDDSAVYACKVTGDGDAAREVSYAQLIVTGGEEPPLVPTVWKEGTEHFLEGVPVRVCCSLPRTPTLTVTWLRSGLQKTSVPEAEERNYTHTTRCFSLTPVRTDNERRLTCEAKNSVGVTQRSMVVRVAYAPRRISIEEGPRVCATEGKPLSLTCRADSYPEPEFSWTVPIGTEHILKTDSFNGRSSTLTLTAVGRRLNGKAITCSVSNSVSRENNLPPVTRNATLDVRYAPSKPIITFSGRRTVVGGDVLVVEGDNITLHCRADRGNPARRPLWSKDSRLMTSLDDEVFQRNLTTLTLKSVKLTDSGVYCCGYSNWVGISVSNGRRIEVIARTYTPSTMQKLFNGTLASIDNTVRSNINAVIQEAPPSTYAAKLLLSSVRVRRNDGTTSAKGSGTSNRNSTKTSGVGSGGSSSSSSNSNGTSNIITASSNNITGNIEPIRNRNRNRISSSTAPTTARKPGRATIMPTGQRRERRSTIPTPNELRPDNTILPFTITPTVEMNSNGETNVRRDIVTQETSSAGQDAGESMSATDSVDSQSTDSEDAETFETTTAYVEDICVE